MADYISRAAAVTHFRMQAKEAQEVFEEYGGESGIEAEVLFSVADELKAFPAVDVAPVRHGRWKETDLVEVDDHGEIYRIPNAGLSCPVCACCFAKKLLWRDSYCPYCGAKMDF